jgi:hypothetical protein
MRVLNKKHWPLQVLVTNSTVDQSTWSTAWTPVEKDERALWCNENLPKGCWFAFRENVQLIFAFKEKVDLTAFTLRWK